ncbi:UNVERIFIED_CONTAM: hypothetical protein O8I53_11850 [Campylobacter lari]
MTDENIRQIARNLKELHRSKLNFPASNHAARVKKYRQIINEKRNTKQVLNDFYKQINTTLAKMDKTKPCHNDL